MGWARFDDNYTDHPKVKPLSPLAELLDVRAIIRCARYTTDGLVTASTLKDIAHQIPTVHKKVDDYANALAKDDVVRARAVLAEMGATD